MATKSETSEIAVLQEQIKQVKGTLVTIQNNQQANFDHLAQKIDALAFTPQIIQAIDERLKVVERKKSPVAFVGLAASLMGGVFAFLIQYALTHR